MIMLLATALIVLLFVISFKKLKDLTNKNDNRIVDCQKKIDEIVNKLQKVEQLDFAKELCDKEREEQIRCSSSNAELFKWYVAEVIAMLTLLFTVWGFFKK